MLRVASGLINRSFCNVDFRGTLIENKLNDQRNACVQFSSSNGNELRNKRTSHVTLKFHLILSFFMEFWTKF